MQIPARAAAPLTQSVPAALAQTMGASSCAEAILALDWAATPLGALESWPPHLLAILPVVLRSLVPMTLLWGELGILLYNDGYAEVVGAGHPRAMGGPVLDIWPEARDFNANVRARVGQGESLSYRDIAFELTRGGVLERAWWNLGYSPVFDVAGRLPRRLAVVIDNAAMMRAGAEREAAAGARRPADMRNRQT